MRIGFRTWKTAVGVSLSVLAAQGMGLDNFASAGILTLLCIQKTRRQSFTAILDRLFACLLALVIAGVFFQLVGYYALLFIPIFLILIPLCVRLRIEGGIASSSVIMMQAYIHGHVDVKFISNELSDYPDRSWCCSRRQPLHARIDRQVRSLRTDRI